MFCSVRRLNSLCVSPLSKDQTWPCFQLPARCCDALCSPGHYRNLQTHQFSLVNVCVDPLLSPLLMVLCGCVAGVAVWWQHGGPALLQGGSHRAQEEALQQQHWFLHQAQCTASGRGVDGWLQMARLHRVEPAAGGMAIVPMSLGANGCKLTFLS